MKYGRYLPGCSSSSSYAEGLDLQRRRTREDIDRPRPRTLNIQTNLLRGEMRQTAQRLTDNAEYMFPPRPKHPKNLLMPRVTQFVNGVCPEDDCTPLILVLGRRPKCRNASLPACSPADPPPPTLGQGKTLYSRSFPVHRPGLLTSGQTPGRYRLVRNIYNGRRYTDITDDNES